MGSNGNIIKKHKNSNFTVVDNDILKNKNLSLKAKGLLIMLLSLPDDWEFSEAGLTVLSKDGRDGLRSGLKELETFGYLKRTQEISGGKFGRIIYNIFEIPLLEKPMSEKPITEKPMSEIPHNKELNNKELNNKVFNNIKDIVELEEIDKIPYKEIIEYLNIRTQKNYRLTDAVKTSIRARVNEGFALDDFKTVIDKKCVEWSGTEMAKYLRPQTLFGTKFDSYLNQEVQPKKNSNPYLDMQFDSEGNLI